ATLVIALTEVLNLHKALSKQGSQHVVRLAEAHPKFMRHLSLRAIGARIEKSKHAEKRGVGHGAGGGVSQAGQGPCSPHEHRPVSTPCQAVPRVFLPPKNALAVGYADRGFTSSNDTCQLHHFRPGKRHSGHSST